MQDYRTVEAIDHLPHILVIDDDPAVTNGMARALRKFATVWTANDGRIGLDIAISKPDLNLAILDVTMPEYEITELLRDMKKANVNLPIVIISGWRREMLSVIENFAKMLGFIVEGVYEKPVHTAEIIKLLKRL